MADNDDASRVYPVGYARPPKEHQFKPGQSGNPKGKPRGAKSIKAMLRAEGRQRVRITENGKIRSISKLELTIKRLFERAGKGELKAIMEVAKLHQQFGFDEELVRVAPLTPEQQEIIDNFHARRARLPSLSSPTDGAVSSDQPSSDRQEREDSHD